MKNYRTAVQIAVIVTAVIAGVLLDRLLFAAGGVSLPRQRASTAAAATTASAAPGSFDSTSSSGSSRDAADGTAQVSRSSAPAKAGSLDSILAQPDQRQRLRDLHAFINAIAPADYPDALKRIRQITSSNERELASRLLVANWVQADPDGALQFAAANRGFEYVAEDVFQQLASSDFDSAISRASGIPGSELRYRALRGILSFKADTDPRAALQLAQTMGDFRGSEPLVNSVYRQWAATDPEAAALHAAEQGQGEGWRSPVAPVVNAWADQDPVAAANFSLSLKDPQAQARSISQVMRQWGREEPNAAANWIHALEPGASRDAAVAGLAQSLVSRDPPTALSWIGTITDDSTRQQTLERVSGVVMWRDPQNGAAMLQAAGLPADQIRDYRRRGRDR